MPAKKPTIRRRTTLLAVCAALALLLFPAVAGAAPRYGAEKTVLRIYEQKSGALLVEVPAETNSRLFFGWIHSQEKIPWNEYYHVDAADSLVLDAISFPAFGAGIPENKGRVCYVRDGLIHMEGIDQHFTELVWLNSHTATRELMLDGVPIASGDGLPHHAVLRLVIEKR